MWLLRKLKAAQTTGEKIVLDGAVALFVALFVGFVLASLSAAGIKRWLAKFEHWDKWKFCLNSAMMPANRRDYDEAYPP